MLSILLRFSKINEFKTYMIDKKYTNDFIKILQIIDNIFFSPAQIRISDEKKFMLANLKGTIFNIFINLCDHDIGISSPDSSSSQDQFYMLENIPSISEIQDMLKTMLQDINLPDEILSIVENLDSNPTLDIKEEDGSLKKKITIASMENLLSSISIIERLSKNVVGQSILMYTEYSKTIRSPNPILSFGDLLAHFTKLIPVLTFTNSKVDGYIISCTEKMIYSFHLLAYNPLTNHLINNDKRKQGMKGYLFKNKTVKSNQSNPFAPIVEFFEPLSKVLSDKAKELLNKSNLSKVGNSSIISTISSTLFEINCINAYMNSNLDIKKDEKKEEKFYLEMDNPKDLEQKMKEIEEKEANKNKFPIFTFRGPVTTSCKLANQSMNLLEKMLDDLITKVNAPWTA